MMFPIENKHCLLNMKKGRLTQTRTIGDSISGLNSDVHLKTRIGKEPLHQISLIQIRLKSPSWCRHIDMCFESRCPSETSPFRPNLVNATLATTTVGLPWENLLTKVNRKGFAKDSTRSLVVFKACSPW